MAALLRITVQDPANILQAYGAGAVVRVHRGSTDAVADASSVTTVPVVAGTTEYEYADLTGVPGTHRYFIRYEKSAVDSSDDVSGWTGPILAGALTGEVITLETIKTWGGVSDTDDDGWLALAVGACNRAIVGGSGVGIDLGSSPDTTRTYDAAAAVRDGTRLWVPGGIRAFTAVEVSTDGSTWTAVTSDVRIGPATHERPPGEPGSYIEFKPYTSSYSTFAGYAYVRITGTAFATFGWDAWPMDLVQAASAAVQRMSLERDRQGQYPTETNALRYLDPNLLRSYRTRYFPAIR